VAYDLLLRQGYLAGDITLATPQRSHHVTPAHWLKILDEARKAVLVFLSDEDNLLNTFMHGPIRISSTPDASVSSDRR